MMSKSLIIVESPTKIKTLKKFLPSNYHFESSLGHVRDLPSKGFGIDVEHDFEPEYVVLPEKKDLIAKLKKLAKEADVVYLAPDPDREGEAIAWHIASILPAKTHIKRITFNAITAAAVKEALKHPREIDIALVDAQQARRLLDRIVGYKISPILQRKIQTGREGFLSAGRVQSVALKLVVDREKEIDVFVPFEYWSLGSLLKPNARDRSFYAYLQILSSKKVEKGKPSGKDSIAIQNKLDADAIEKKLAKAHYKVKSLERKEKHRNPVPPFITSTLQQEASRHYAFSATRTMKIAQSLYEGVELGSLGTEGLITYMRTDSVRAAPEAIIDGRKFIESTYGKKFLPEKEKIYASKGNAQDAHECIRPTNVYHTPEEIKKYLTPDEYKIYLIIWRRFLASQMMPAIYDTVTCDIETDQDLQLRATGSIIKFQGFLVLYNEIEDKEEKEDEEDESEKILPPLEVGQTLLLEQVISKQCFTRPPARYSEATLVKALEKSGIGRPSTYASIMNKIQSRDYTVKEKNYLKPTELGKVICQMLEDNFKMIMDIGFTAKMEQDLDEIADSHVNWKEFIKEFWEKFIPTVETAAKEAHVPKMDTDIKCPECGAHLQKIWARGKYFYGCSNYPECKYTSPMEAIAFDKSEYAENFDWEQKCPKCESSMTVRHGRFGTFLGCSKYPECKGIVNIPKKGELLPEDLPNCPAIDCPGKIVARKSRFGKTFFACSTYPECDVIGNSLENLDEKYQSHPRTPAPVKAKWKDKREKKGFKAAKGKEAKGSKGKKVEKELEVKKEKAKPKGKVAAKSKTKAAAVKKGKPGGTLTLSKELAEIVGSAKLSRPEVTKKVWEYIKKHKLQDPKNKRLIKPDAKLKKVFGSEKSVDMMKLAGILSKHMKSS